MKDETSATEPSAASQGKPGPMTFAPPPRLGAAVVGSHGSCLAGIRRFIAACFAALVRMQQALGGSEPVRPYEAQATQNRDADELGRKLGIAEAELAANTRLIALTSHELRTPLNGILGMADLLTRTPLSREQESYVQAINTSASALLSLVNDMLDAGRIAAGRWPSKPQPVAIEALVEEVVELLAPRAQSKGLELAAHVAMQVPETVSADPDQLIRILMNLTGNAIKFTDRGGVAIDVSVERETAAAATLTLCVRDSGVGIPLEDQARIFGEYEQVGTDGMLRSNGTGLGLAISRDIARAMGGDITLKSSSGDGSIFCFRADLPVLRPSMPMERPFNGRHILLISDKIIEPPVLMRRLFDLGASVELARTVKTARSVLTAGRRVDAILFDHSASLDSAEFRTAMDESAPPIAVMVAPADRHALERIRRSGIKAHLIKPMRTGSLTKVISAMFSNTTVEIPSVEGATRVEPANVRQATSAVALKILLVDDNDINVLLGQSALRSLGQAAEVANNGARAVAQVAEAVRLGYPHDVILMDLHMPELDGFAAIEAIRSAEQNSDRRAFIVALTADNTEQSSIRAIEAGADFAMTKPIQQRLLADVLERARLARSPPKKRTQKRRKPAV